MPVVQTGAYEPATAVHRIVDRAGGHVARALHDHRQQPGARFPAILLGSVPRHPLGLGDLLRHDRSVPVPVLSVHPPAADDLNLRGPHAAAAGQSRGGAGSMRPPIYGVMAEFDNPTALVNATRRAAEEGYRKLDAYTPFPVEELSDVLHLHKNKLPLIVLLGGIAGL